MAKLYNVIYRGLKSTKKEREKFQESCLNIHDSVAAFQRAFIAIQDTKTKEIVKSYNVVGFAIDHDGEIGNIEFEIELGTNSFAEDSNLRKLWNKHEKDILSTGKTIETYLEIDEKGKIPLREPKYITRYIQATGYFLSHIPVSKMAIESMTIEQYLMARGNMIGIFKQLGKQYRRAQKRTAELYRELYPELHQIIPSKIN